MQSVKDHLKGYEKGLADAETTPRTKELQMAVVQAKLKGYSEVRDKALTWRSAARVTNSPLWTDEELRKALSTCLKDIVWQTVQRRAVRF